MARDWVADLEEFGPSIVEEACNEWRRAEERRPTIAAMRKLCAELRPRLSTPQDSLRARDEDEATRMADEWAIKRGFMNIAHFQRESMVGASVQMAGGRWKRFPGLKQPAAMPDVRRSEGFKSAAAAPGVKAREYTPEEMAASRRELGIDIGEAAE